MTGDSVYRDTGGLTGQAVRILRGRGTATIGTVGADGLPHLAPVWFLYDEDEGWVGFESSSRTRKVRNVLQTGVGSVFTSGDLPGGGTLTVLGQGSARVLTGAGFRAVAARVRAKYVSPAGLGPVSRYLDGVDDVAVVLEPRKWVTWNTSSMNDVIRGLPEYAEGMWREWFLRD